MLVERSWIYMEKIRGNSLRPPVPNLGQLVLLFQDLRQRTHNVHLLLLDVDPFLPRCESLHVRLQHLHHSLHAINFLLRCHRIRHARPLLPDMDLFQSPCERLDV